MEAEAEEGPLLSSVFMFGCGNRFEVQRLNHSMRTRRTHCQSLLFQLETKGISQNGTPNLPQNHAEYAILYRETAGLGLPLFFETPVHEILKFHEGVPLKRFIFSREAAGEREGWPEFIL